jgi:F-type H+-transporting ATPase subunit delta
MAELATIARPYAEALFKAVAQDTAESRTQLASQMGNLATLAAAPELRQFADNPKTAAVQVFDIVAGVALGQGLTLDKKVGNLLRAVIDNGRLAALPEIATQFQGLVNAKAGISEATVQSAFAIDAGQLAEVVASLEKRFARKLNARVEVVPELIGGIRAIIGDEVLDTSVKARLEQMKMALTA